MRLTLIPLSAKYFTEEPMKGLTDADCFRQYCKVGVFMITCLLHENHVTPKAHIGIFVYYHRKPFFS